MSASHLYPALLLIAIVVISQHSLAADPHAKPKLVPRPVPGLPHFSVPTITSSGHRKPITPQAPATMVDPTNQARVVAIYRRGTFTAPKDSTTTSPQPTEPTQAQPQLPEPPRPGQVRILTKAEAAMLAAKPTP